VANLYLSRTPQGPRISTAQEPGSKVLDVPAAVAADFTAAESAYRAAMDAVLLYHQEETGLVPPVRPVTGAPIRGIR
jgi:hypothetical protein